MFLAPLYFWTCGHNCPAPLPVLAAALGPEIDLTQPSKNKKINSWRGSVIAVGQMFGRGDVAYRRCNVTLLNLNSICKEKNGRKQRKEGKKHFKHQFVNNIWKIFFQKLTRKMLGTI